MKVWVVSFSWKDDYDYGNETNIFKSFEGAKSEFDKLVKNVKTDYQSRAFSEMNEEETSFNIYSTSGFDEFNFYIDLEQKEVYE